MVRALVEGFDRRVDEFVAGWRGRPAADAFAAVASALGDHGLVWFLVGLARARHRGRRRAVAARAVVFAGLVTPAVNHAVKAAVGRARPAGNLVEQLPVRIPRTTSFPSGHALAAWCAATLLADGDPLAPAYFTMAGAISLSRVHVELHHASDVAGGAVLGVALGLLGRRLLPIASPSPPSRRNRRRAVRRGSRSPGA